MAISETQRKAAVTQMTETMISTGIAIAERVRSLKAKGENFNIGIAPGGGLALIFVKGDARKEIKPHFRFGAPHSTGVARVNLLEVESWNRQHPQHPVEMKPIQTALAEEAVRVFALLSELRKADERVLSSGS